MPFLRHLNEQSDIRDILLGDVKRFSPLNKFADNVLRLTSDFTRAERELMAAYVSGLNRCSYCFGAHDAVAKEFGVDSHVLMSLLNDIENAEIDQTLKPVFHYIKKLTLTPSTVSEADAQNVFDAGWSEQALTDLVCVCALFNLYNRLLDGHGIKGNQHVYLRDGAHIRKYGYRIPWYARFHEYFGK